MRITLTIALSALLSGCAGTSPSEPSDGAPTGGAAGVERSHTELVLDAVLCDVVNNPSLGEDRDFYGTPGAGRVALVTNVGYGVPWPADYKPDLAGWTVSRAEEGLADPAAQRLLGVRIDGFDFEDDGQTAAYIVITVINAGGSGNGAVVGGCSITYRATRTAGKWAVELVMALDP